MTVICSREIRFVGRRFTAWIEIDLPMPPFVGLCIGFAGGVEVEVRHIHYDAESGRVVATMDTDRGGVESGAQPERADVEEDYPGWTVR